MRQLPLLALARYGVTRISVGFKATSEDIAVTHRAPKSADELASALRDAREYTRRCYAHLEASDPLFPCIPLVNPARWELGHVGWFQEYWCRRHGGAMRPGDPASCGVPSRFGGADALWDSSNVPHDSRWSLPVPDWRTLGRYLGDTLADTLDALERSRDGDRYFFELALYHEDMHGEALAMTLQTLGLPPPAGWRSPSTVAAGRHSGDVAFEGGRFAMGSDGIHARTRFVFDNERRVHDVPVAPFALARACVTEGEFAAFVDDGGYARPELWTDAGRQWLEGARRAMPAYWRRANGGSEVRWFDRWRPLSPGAAVQHVNAHEAEAWCRWAKRRLPTEAEWEFAALAQASVGSDANLDGAHAGPIASASVGDGVAHLLGNVWEWTASAFEPYPEFAPDPYVDYSKPWFGDHHVIRGGSWATRSRLVHPRMRNFYLPARHDMFVGFRTCALG